jgi:hypothetical protein
MSTSDPPPVLTGNAAARGPVISAADVTLTGDADGEMFLRSMLKGKKRLEARETPAFIVKVRRGLKGDLQSTADGAVLVPLLETLFAGHGFPPAATSELAAAVFSTWKSRVQGGSPPAIDVSALRFVETAGESSPGSGGAGAVMTRDRTLLAIYQDDRITYDEATSLVVESRALVGKEPELFAAFTSYYQKNTGKEWTGGSQALYGTGDAVAVRFAVAKRLERGAFPPGIASLQAALITELWVRNVDGNRAAQASAGYAVTGLKVRDQAVVARPLPTFPASAASAGDLQDRYRALEYRFGLFHYGGTRFLVPGGLVEIKRTLTRVKASLPEAPSAADLAKHAELTGRAAQILDVVERDFPQLEKQRESFEKLEPAFIRDEYVSAAEGLMYLGLRSLAAFDEEKSLKDLEGFASEEGFYPFKLLGINVEYFRTLKVPAQRRVRTMEETFDPPEEGSDAEKTSIGDINQWAEQLAKDVEKLKSDFWNQRSGPADLEGRTRLVQKSLEAMGHWDAAVMARYFLGKNWSLFGYGAVADLAARCRAMRDAYRAGRLDLLTSRVDAYAADPSVSEFYTKRISRDIFWSKLVVGVAVNVAAAIISMGATVAVGATGLAAVAVEAITFTFVTQTISYVTTDYQPTIGSVGKDLAFNIGLFGALRGFKILSGALKLAPRLMSGVVVAGSLTTLQVYGMLRFRFEQKRYPTTDEVEDMAIQNVVMFAVILVVHTAVPVALRATGQFEALARFHTVYGQPIESLGARREALAKRFADATAGGKELSAAEGVELKALADALEKDMSALVDKVLAERKVDLAKLRAELAKAEPLLDGVHAEITAQRLGIPLAAKLRAAGGQLQFSYETGQTRALTDAMEAKGAKVTVGSGGDGYATLAVELEGTRYFLQERGGSGEAGGGPKGAFGPKQFPTPAIAKTPANATRWTAIEVFAKWMAEQANKGRVRLAGIDVAKMSPAERNAALEALYQSFTKARHDKALELAAGDPAKVADAKKIITPIPDGDPNYDPFGDIEKLEGSPAHGARAEIGEIAQKRFDGTSGDTVQTKVTLPDGTTVDGNTLHRGASAEKINAAKGDKYGFGAGAKKIVTETATPENQQKLHDAGVRIMGELAARSGEIQGSEAMRARARETFATALYALFQGPINNRGSDSVIRLFGTVMYQQIFGRVVTLPHDVDIRVYAADQASFVHWLGEQIAAGK